GLQAARSVRCVTPVGAQGTAQLQPALRSLVGGQKQRCVVLVAGVVEVIERTVVGKIAIPEVTGRVILRDVGPVIIGARLGLGVEPVGDLPRRRSASDHVIAIVGLGILVLNPVRVVVEVAIPVVLVVARERLVGVRL